MEKQSLNKHIATYKMLQGIPALNMPCPRCGQHRMEKDMAENALSRYTDIYICSDCGREEAMLEASEQMPMEKWYAVRFLCEEVIPYERIEPEKKEPYYMLSANVSAKVCDKDIDDIMCAALEEP